MTVENTGVANIHMNIYIVLHLVSRFEALKVYTHVVCAHAAQHARKVDNHDQLYNNSRYA